MNAAAPAVSVLLPAYQAAGTVGAAIASVLAQTASDLELIVVDDGSTDGTGEIAERTADPRVRVLRQPNMGAAAARNTALEAARAPLVAFVDSDDLWLGAFLERMRAVFAGDPRLALVYTDAWVVDAATGRVNTSSAMQWQHPPTPPPADPDEFLLELLRRNFMYNAVVARRDVLIELGGFDDGLRAAIDYDMWLRVAVARRPIGWLPGRHAVYRRDRAGSISSDKVRMFGALGEVYRRVAEDPEASHSARALAEARAASVARSLAAARRGPGLRARIRDGLIALRNAALGHERWLRTVPPELAETLRYL